MEKNRVVVTIFGKQYGIMSEVSPEYTKEAAAYLDGKMKEIAKNYPNISESRVAVLAALNITDELFGCQCDLNGWTQTQKRLDVLTRRLSEAIIS